MLGLGASQIGNKLLDDAEVGRLLNGVLDAGITLIDTAHCYGQSEERIGRYIADRRDEYVLSSKTGHRVDGVEDWTAQAVREAVELSLTRMKTDHIDVMHLHSCSLDDLQTPGLIDELDKLVAEGKIGFAAYSGENDALKWAAESGRFACLETSLNVADQWSLGNVLPLAAERGLGVIAKRPVANAWWLDQTRPEGKYGETYWDRMQVLAYETDLEPLDLALRFAAFAPGVSCAITGSTNLDNLRRNVEVVGRGPLPEEVVTHVRQRWAEAGKDDSGVEWPGEA